MKKETLIGIIHTGVCNFLFKSQIDNKDRQYKKLIKIAIWPNITSKPVMKGSGNTASPELVFFERISI
jgi:hypothetical protein